MSSLTGSFGGGIPHDLPARQGKAVAANVLGQDADDALYLSAVNASQDGVDFRRLDGQIICQYLQFRTRQRQGHGQQ